MIPYTQSVVRVRAGEREDRGGGTVPDWSPGAVTETLIEHLSVQPNVQREEFTDAGNRRETGYRILSQPGTTPDIQATDRVRYRGDMYQVVGEVAYWPSPVPDDDHIELVIVRYEGG